MQRESTAILRQKCFLEPDPSARKRERNKRGAECDPQVLNTTVSLDRVQLAFIVHSPHRLYLCRYLQFVQAADGISNAHVADIRHRFKLAITAEVGRCSSCSENYRIGFQLRAVLEQEALLCESLQFRIALYLDPTISDHFAWADTLEKHQQVAGAD